MKRRRALPPLLAIALLLVGDPGAACAEDATDDAPAGDDAARQLFESSRTAYEEGRYEEAVRGFEQVFGQTGHAVMLINIANAWAKLHQRQRAAEALRQYLRISPDDPQRATLEARIAILDAPGDSAGTRADSAASGLWAGRTWTWVALGAGLAAGATSAVVGLRAQSRYDELASSCGTDGSCSQRQVDDVSSDVTLTNVTLGVSLLALVTGGILYFIEGDDERLELRATSARSASVTVRF